MSGGVDDIEEMDCGTYLKTRNDELNNLLSEEMQP